MAKTPPIPPPAESLWARTDEPLHWIAHAGHETWRDRSYFFDCIRRTDTPHHVLQFTLAGACFYERDGVRSLLSAGRAFLDRIPGDFRYGYPPDARIPYEQVFLSLTGPANDALCARIIDEFGHILDFGIDSPVQNMLLSIVHQYAAGTLRDRYLVSGLVYQLLMTILSCLKSRQLATSQLLHAAVAAIDLHAPDPTFNVIALARQLHCSREHLSRQFRQAIGVSAGDYIIQHRLGAVARLLRQTDSKLDVIAAQTGFASANYLCRAFRQRYGITPAQFRRTPWFVTE